MRKATIINIAKGTFLSILIFISISFVTVLLQINSLYYSDNEPYKLAIGFPFIYYNQFWIDGAQIPNSGWRGNYLFYDCIITWVVVGLVYGAFKKNSLGNGSAIIPPLLR